MTPLSSSLISLYETMVRNTLAKAPEAHHTSWIHGLFFGGKKAWWRTAVDGMICDSVYAACEFFVSIMSWMYRSTPTSPRMKRTAFICLPVFTAG